MTEQHINLKLKINALAKHITLKGYIEWVLSRDDEQISSTGKWVVAYRVISDMLDVGFDMGDVLADDFDTNRILSYYLEKTVDDDDFYHKLIDNFGFDISTLHLTYMSILALNYILSYRSLGEFAKDANPQKLEIIKEQIKEGDEFIRRFTYLQSSVNLTFKKYMPPEIINSLNKVFEFIEPQKIDYDKLNDEISHLVNSIYPNIPQIDFSLDNAIELNKKLKECKIGKKDWRKYENTCIDILKFLFIPEFSSVHVQKRTENGHQVRDAIIPNNQEKGFWKNIKTEFDSKNIVCEFKNGKSKNVDKNSLNQLRIYLNKKTIGRFGMIFIRESPSKSLLKARRLAYEESGILILIIDDLLAMKLLYARALFGDCSEILMKEKIQFEVEY